MFFKIAVLKHFTKRFATFIGKKSELESLFEKVAGLNSFFYTPHTVAASERFNKLKKQLKKVFLFLATMIIILQILGKLD